MDVRKENRHHPIMHPFPPAAELQFIVGREFGQIVLDPNGVQFRWVEGGQITAQHIVDHLDEHGVTHIYDCSAFTGPPLMLHRLLMKKIMMLNRQDFCLTLMFEGGQRLKLFSEDGPYECGIVMLGDDFDQDFWVF